MYWQTKLVLSIIIVSLTSIFFVKCQTKEKNKNISKIAKPIKKVKETSISNKNNIISKEEIKKDLIPKTENKKISKNNILLRQAKEMYKKNHYDKALGKLYKIIKNKNFLNATKEEKKSFILISLINSKILKEKLRSQYQTVYKVKSGDNLNNIAIKEYTVFDQIQKMNSIANPHLIRANMKLSFFSGPWKIIIYKSKYLALVYRKNKFFKFYKIGIGKNNKTPEGKFTIVGKLKHPVWEKPNGEKISPGDKRNLLGTRWMRFIEETKVITGYGIHGTNEKDSIGKKSSQGCIRMTNEEVEELYSLIPEKTPAEIFP